MDDKVLDSVGNMELADQAGGAIPTSDAGRNMTRDEGEMAFYGKKQQLKVRLLNGSATANVARLMTPAEIRAFVYHWIYLQSSGNLGSNVFVSAETDPL